MSCDLPVFSKCCFCIPLRPGLLVLAYLRLIAAILVLLFLLLSIHVQFEAIGLLLMTVLLLIVVANLVFSVVFVIGVHKKDTKLLRVYFSFSIFMLALTIFLFLFTMVLKANLAFHHAPTVLMENIGRNISSVVDILIQLYFIAVIRSEILKLKAEKVKFTIAGGEASVEIDIPTAKQKDIKCNVLYSDKVDDALIQKVPLFPVEELKKLQKDSAFGKE